MIVDIAHASGVTVEAELGHVGATKNMDDENEDFYTNVEQAKEFVEKTNIDCLAVAIGTAHGTYPKGKIPKLDFERLKQLKNALNIPLVLHGGSGSGEENINKAVLYGINKINVCTDAFAVARQSMLDSIGNNPSIDYMDISKQVQYDMKEFIRQYMKMIGSTQRFNYNKNRGPVYE